MRHDRNVVTEPVGELDLVRDDPYITSEEVCRSSDSNKPSVVNARAPSEHVRGIHVSVGKEGLRRLLIGIKVATNQCMCETHLEYLLPDWTERLSSPLPSVSDVNTHNQHHFMGFVVVKDAGNTDRNVIDTPIAFVVVGILHNG